MESVFAVAGVGRVPSRSGVFVGRSDQLARLDAAVPGAVGRAVVVAVHGLGGVGKSTLAARFAELHADRFAPVWWVTADSPAQPGWRLSRRRQFGARGSFVRGYPCRP
ncbi:AAA family ATPase [Saccharothrix violaceirubra]